VTWQKNTIVQVSSNHLATELEGETVILSFATGEYFGLDEVGSLIWGQIQQPISVDQICQAVLAEYDVDEAECYDDTVMLLDQMLSRQLITIQTT
jgi:hypothetical protein